MEIYLVGGAVRDKLLNLPITDRDWVVVGSSTEEMAAAKFKPVGADFPVFLHPETHEEYALARTERKTAKGYKGFKFHTSPEVTLEQDLTRRDLTINAIAEDLEGRLLDPCNGEADIKARLLRHVSPAFAEDPVRILRVARLAARFKPLGFSIAPETMGLMREMVHAGEVDALVPERAWQEMEKSLALPNARVFFETLKDCGALEIILPELDALFGIPQPEQWHPEIDSGLHTMMALEQACLLTEDRCVRFATVCHDFGKALTPEEKLPSHPGHELAGVPLVETFCNRLKVPNAYRTLALHVTQYHVQVHRVEELRGNTLTKLLGALDVIRKPERFNLFLLSCEADARGRLGLENREYTQPDRMRQAATAYRSVDASLIANAESDSTKIAEKIYVARMAAVKQAIANF